MNSDPHSGSGPNLAVPPPKPVVVAGAVSILLGLIAAGFGVAVGVAAVLGRSFPGLSSPATAIAFLAFGGAFGAAGWSLLKGKAWGRGVIVIFCLILLPIAYGTVKDSQQPLIGYPLGIAALANLVCLFVPSALRWTQGNRTF
ncbi:MAG: formate--tetrahydrofolate ligase [Segniliparus sp.]|uniref:formate--tetrahydrofolate ligase n=1 Tax=Segniliparus sp. TaxID=2804064 RepID=UPI003F32FFC9